MTTRSFFLLGLLGGLAFQALVGVLAFVCAGRWDLPMFWAFFGVWLATMLVGALLADPDLARERVRPGPGGKDYGTTALLTAYWVGQPVLAGLDVGRFHWSDGVPLELQIVGLAVMTAALAVVVWAVAVNRFFSSVLRIQTDRGHHVISSGPYRYVRHPGYAAALSLGVAGGLALGSWLAALVGLLMIGPILRRTLQEDRMLHDQLEGYAAYAQRFVTGCFPECGERILHLAAAGGSVDNRNQADQLLIFTRGGPWKPHNANGGFASLSRWAAWRCWRSWGWGFWASGMSGAGGLPRATRFSLRCWPSSRGPRPRKWSARSAFRLK